MLAVGETLQGRYRIIREIGAGGMGTVYEGENLLIRRRVAIKVMRENAVDRSDLRARFELEARIASQIPSDHITEVLDLGELPGGQRFIVMEYLVGESLSARLERVQRMPPRELLGLARQVLVALGASHQAGVIHRDVKPDNVFILSEKAGQRDFVKLLDFGVSKLRPGGAEIPLTQSGVFVGTPGYMAPEQVGGTQPSPAWDLYAVGVILYRGLTGEMPFQSEHVHELMCKVVLGNFSAPSERVSDLDPALDALVCKAMSRSPEQRFQSAEQFISGLDGYLAARGARSPPSLGLEVATIQTPSGNGTGAPAISHERPAVPVFVAPTPVSTKLGAGRERGSTWLGWTAAGVLSLLAGALLVSWRSQHQVEDTALQVETHAVEPALRPAASAAAPRSVAPAAPLVPAPPAPVPPAPTSSPAAPPAPTPRAPALPAPSAPLVQTVAQPGASGSAPVASPNASSVAAPEPRSEARRPLARPSVAPQRAAPHAKPPHVAAAPQSPVAPSTHADESSGKYHPDWGY